MPTYPADSPDLRCFFIGTAIGKDSVITTPKEMHVSVKSDVSQIILLRDHLLQQHGENYISNKDLTVPALL